ncbi:MAG: aspartate kinase [Oscillospiraceae bacterium]|nr:aspartate kinase [Oscillospiraceae bacterium]
MVKVVKFGGSSLANAAQLRKVRAIVLADDAIRAVVVSAPGKDAANDKKITDLLYRCCDSVNDVESFNAAFDVVRARFAAIDGTLGLGVDMEAEFSAIRARCAEDFSASWLVSRGEYLTAKLVAACLGFTFVDAADWLCFDFDKKVDVHLSYKKFREIMEKHERVVTPGFYGVLPSGEVHLFPRGGSDLTGAYAAAALRADMYENWTDVPGILMADPKVIDAPKPIARITYDELRELSYMGAVVVHAETVFPLLTNGIPLHIRNTNDPAAPGTRVDEAVPDRVGGFVTGIAGKQHYSILSIYKNGMSGHSKYVRRALEACEKRGVNVEHIPKGIDDFALVVSGASLRGCLDGLLADIKAECEPDLIDVAHGMSLIAVVGARMARQPGVAGQLFGALGAAGISIRIIEQGAAERSIIFGVADADFERSIRVLYDSFS